MQTPSNTSAPVSSGFLLHPSCPGGETDAQDWGLGLTVGLLLQKTLLWEVTGGSSPGRRDVLRSCMGSRSSWSFYCLAALGQQLYQPLGSMRLGLFLKSSAPLLRVLAPEDTQESFWASTSRFLHRDGAGLKGGGLCDNQECQEGIRESSEVSEGCQPPR